MQEHERQGRWSLWHLHQDVMVGMPADQRIEVIAEQDEHLGNLERLRDDAARIGYRLNAIAPAEPDGGFGFPGMQAAFEALTQMAELRWEQINQGGRLEVPALWRRPTAEQLAAPDRQASDAPSAVSDDLEAEAVRMRQLANRLTALAVRIADAEDMSEDPEDPH